MRQYQAAVYHSLFRADDEILVSLHASGVAPGWAAVLRLHLADAAGMARMYLTEFERIWAGSVQVR